MRSAWPRMSPQSIGSVWTEADDRAHRPNWDPTPHQGTTPTSIRYRWGVICTIAWVGCARGLSNMLIRVPNVHWNKAKRSAKHLRSDVINAVACGSCWQQQSGWSRTTTTRTSYSALLLTAPERSNKKYRNIYCAQIRVFSSKRTFAEFECQKYFR